MEEKMFNLMEKMYSEFQGMKTDIQGMKTDIQGMKTDIQGMKTDIQGMKTDIIELKEGQARLEQRQTRLEIIIETEIKEKLSALFDGHVMHAQKLEKIENKIDSMQMDINTLQVKTVNNDTRIIGLTNELRRIK